MVKTKFKIQFTFDNLAKDASRFVEEVMKEVGSETINSMKSVIKEAPYKPLTPTRKRKREEGVGFPDSVTGVPNRGGDTPLEQSGSLYDSMEYIKGQGIHMNHYGLTHNDGLKDDFFPQYTMPDRPFIDRGLERTDLDKIVESFYNKLEEAITK